MGDDIKTSRLVEQKSKQTAIDDRPKPMSSPNNKPSLAKWLPFKAV